MNIKNYIFKKVGALFIAAALAGGGLAHAAVINHNINTGGNLIIQGTSTDDYYVSGTGVETSNRIIVESGYQGTVTLDNVNIHTTNATGTKDLSPFRVKGVFNGNNKNPVTRTTIILKGENMLQAGIGNRFSTTTTGVTELSDAAALQVDAGAQILLRAFDENDNASGQLVAASFHNSDGAAGIGGPCVQRTVGDGASQGTFTGTYMKAGTTPTNGTGKRITGGNIIISSGTIWARGGRCGAGIGGGGWQGLYTGNIVIVGGNVTSIGGDHSAGIGSGCDDGAGNNGTYVPGTDVVCIPPASIAASTITGGKGLSGSENIVYIGDPQSPLLTVRTVDNEPNADIYADLTENPDITDIFGELDIEDLVDLTKIKFGRTNAAGLYTINATLKNNTTFFTDASSSQPATFGRPYKPQTTIVTSAKTLILPLLDINMSIENISSIPLETGYTGTQAFANSQGVKITYSDTKSMTGITWGLQSGSASSFSGAQFFSDAAFTTSIAAPTSLTNGMTVYIKFPIKTGKDIGIYSEIYRFSGTYDGAATGYIRMVITQRVVYNDTNTNTYIKVTASPASFVTNSAGTATATLQLQINHSGLSVPYDAADVTAKYLITTEPNYAAALAANPIGTWSNLTIPSTEGALANTAAPFTGKPNGTYYIHWYVVSGVVYAHSRDWTSPAATYGAFGKYIIDTTKPTATLKVDGQTTSKNINTLAALPVTVNFTKTITNPSALTASQFDILPAGSGTISGIAVVSGSADSIFTATLTPSASLGSGDGFTVKVKANAVHDAANNNNDASNVVTVVFNNATKPVATFNNVSHYATLTPSFTVDIVPSDYGINANTDLFATAGGAAIAAGTNLNTLFTITQTGGSTVPTSVYTAMYSKSGAGASAKGVVTISFISPLTNSKEYTATLAVDKIFNKLQNGNNVAVTTFKIAQPDFSDTDCGIFASPTLFTNTGGTTTLSIVGKALKMNAEDGLLSLRVTSTYGYDSGQLTDGSSYLTVGAFDHLVLNNVPVPANTGNTTLTHTYTLHMTFGGPEAPTGKSCTVQVEPAASLILSVVNGTTSTTDLTFGYTLSDAQATTRKQNITVTNNGAQTLNGLTVTLIGTDGAVFAASTPSTTSLASGGTATFYVYLTVGQNAGVYGHDDSQEGGPVTKVSVSATVGAGPTVVNGSAALVEQVVLPKSGGTTGDGYVSGTPNPSTTWSNNNEVQLSAFALGTGDYVLQWRYAVTNTNVAPADADPAWTPIVGGITTATYNFASGTDGTYYIFYKLNTNNITGINGQVQDAASVKTYNIDLVKPHVTAITSERSTTNATPFWVKVQFSEPVSLADATKFAAIGASVGTPTPEGAAVDGRYTEWKTILTPSAGLSSGDMIIFHVQANAMQDKAGNYSLQSLDTHNPSIVFDSLNPNVTLTTPLLHTNANFVVTATFSKAVTGLTLSAFNIVNGATTGSLGGSGTTYTFTVSTTSSASGNIIITLPANSAFDASGNGNTAASLTVDYRDPTDKIGAVLTYTPPAHTYENGAFNVYVNFSRQVTGLLATDFVLSGASDFVAPTLSGSGNSYVLALTPLANVDASTTVTLPGSVTARDIYGNTLDPSNTVTAFYDTRRPLVSSLSAGGRTEVNDTAFTITVAFDEPIIHSFDGSRLQLVNLDFISVSAPTVVGTTTEYTVTLQATPGTQHQVITSVRIGEGVVKDKAMNPNMPGGASDFLQFVYVDDTPPFITSMIPEDDNSPTRGYITFTFNEPMDATPGRVWLDDYSIRLTDGKWLNNRTYTLRYAGLLEEEDYIIFVADFHDLAGNLMDPNPDIYRFRTGKSAPAVLLREVVLLPTSDVTIMEGAGEHYVASSQNFSFTVNIKAGNDASLLVVTTGNEVRDRDGVRLTVNPDGTVTVTLLLVNEHLMVNISIRGGTGNVAVDNGSTVWTYSKNLYVQTPNAGTLRIYDAAGKLIKLQEVSAGETRIAMSPGLYVVQFEGKNYKIEIY